MRLVGNLCREQGPCVVKRRVVMRESGTHELCCLIAQSYIDFILDSSSIKSPVAQLVKLSSRHQASMFKLLTGTQASAVNFTPHRSS